MGRKSKFAMLLSLLFLLPVVLTACGAAPEQAHDLPAEETVAIEDDSGAESSEVQLEGETEMNIQITVGGQVFAAVLEDNPTAKALYERLPVTIEMKELNGNEKYYYFDSSFPTNPSSVGKIHAGDLMLYGSDCLVLFYKDHGNTYSYTRLGAIEDADGLARAVGDGNVSVTWEKA